MSNELEAHAETLGDTSAYFLDPRATYSLVVDHVTGTPRYVLTGDGHLEPYAAAPPEAGVVVVNPPGWSGFPVHDREDQANYPESYGLDEGDYFVHWEADHPTFVLNATGRPAFRVVDGVLVQIEG